MFLEMSVRCVISVISVISGLMGTCSGQTHGEKGSETPGVGCLV